MTNYSTAVTKVSVSFPATVVFHLPSVGGPPAQPMVEVGEELVEEEYPYEEEFEVRKYVGPLFVAQG